MDLKYLGIFREAEHSPDRVVDDELILRAVADNLSNMEQEQVRVIFPAELLTIEQQPEVIFNMAEEEPVLERLEKFEQQGVSVVNSVQGVRNTFRKEMTAMLDGVSFVPDTVICSTSNPPQAHDFSVWVKRGDYHAIETNDVVLAENARELEEILCTFKKRGIDTVVLQRHVPGDLIKFYGVREPDHGINGKTRWFHWFYHKDQDLKNYPFEIKELQSRCEQAADRLCLEIFGGDAIITRQGEIFIIDVNAWPSFALFRDTAARHIAQHLRDKVNINQSVIFSRAAESRIDAVAPRGSR